nr:hypothetical protein [Tanacetum cinerariifolium]
MISRELKVRLWSTNRSNYRLRDWRSNGIRVKNWRFRLDNLRLDVFSAFVVSRIHCVLYRIWFIFHRLRKKRRRGWNLRLKNPPSKHIVFEELELGKQELGKLEVGKQGVDKQEREENQEDEFDLTSSEDDSWYFLGFS